MNAIQDKAAVTSGVYTRLESIRMSEPERMHAYASLRQGELVAELVQRAAADMRAVAQCVEGAGASLANAIKAMFARHAKH